MASRAIFEPIRTLAFGSISGAYANVGSALTKEARAFCITNDTDGDLYFTLDSSEDQIFLVAGSFRLYDIQANIGHIDDRFVLPIGAQFQVKQVTAPTEGTVYIEIMY